MTPEAGDQADGFWPVQARIVPICQQNLPMDLNAARLLLAYGKAKDKDSRYISQTSGFFHYDLQRLGLASPATFSVSIQPITSYITSVGSADILIPSLRSLQTVANSSRFTLNASTPQGTSFLLPISVNNGTFTWSDTLTKIYGTTTIAYSTNASSITGWTSVGGWNTTTSSYYSAPSSITDSPSGNYATNANTSIAKTTAVSLANTLSAELTFETKFALETGYDYSEVEVSPDNGTTWTALCGKYTTNNSLDGGNPTYTGFQSAWVKEEMSLDNFIGQNILIRFRLSSDQGTEYDGFYFDDLKVVVVPNSGNGVNEFLSNDLFTVYPN